MKHFRAAKAKVAEVKFVKASDQRSSASSKPGPSGLVGLKKKMTFVKSSDEYESTKSDATKTNIQDQKSIFVQESECQIPQNRGQRFGLGAAPNLPKKVFKDESVKTAGPSTVAGEDMRLRKFYQLANFLLQIKQKSDGNSVSLLNMAAQKTQIQPEINFKSEQGTFICELIFNGAVLSVGRGTNKKTAKSESFDKCVEKLGKPFLRLSNDISGKLILESSVEPFSDLTVTQESEPPIKKSKTNIVSQSVPGSFEAGTSFPRHSESAADEARLEQFQQLGVTFRNLKCLGQNPTQLIHMAIQKCQSGQMKLVVDFKQDGVSFICDVMIDNVLVAQGNGASKKAAKTHAFEVCSEVMTNPYLRIIQPESNLFVLESSHVPFANDNPLQICRTPKRGMDKVVPKIQNQKANIQRSHQERREPMSHFILMQPNVPDDQLNAITVLQNSAVFNRVQIQYEYFDLQSGVQCNLYLGDDQIADVTASKRQEAKQYAADLALVKLRDKCWTIQSKQQADTNETGISKDEVKGNKINESIPESNVGNQLLKKMGWVGGGIGKSGQGIAEPVSVDSVINRSGLGLQAEQGIAKDFLPRVKAIIMDYAKSRKFGDLIFTSEFSKEERALIHKESQKLGLKSHSHGKGEDRYLILSRKMSAREIFDYVQQNGGETPKYSLVPPGSS